MIMEAALEVAKPVIFAILIVVIVFIPILTLEGVEGKMFVPMSYTLCFALLGSLIFAIVIAPPLASFLLHTGEHKDSRFFIWLQKLHDPALEWAVKKPAMILLIVAEIKSCLSLSTVTSTVSPGIVAPLIITTFPSHLPMKRPLWAGRSTFRIIFELIFELIMVILTHIG